MLNCKYRTNVYNKNNNNEIKKKEKKKQSESEEGKYLFEHITMQKE